MTIQEALRSGKPLRRKAWGLPKDLWLIVVVEHFVVIRFAHSKNMFGEYSEIYDRQSADVFDILADDWEVKSDG